MLLLGPAGRMYSHPNLQTLIPPEPERKQAQTNPSLFVLRFRSGNVWSPKFKSEEKDPSYAPWVTDLGPPRTNRGDRSLSTSVSPQPSPKPQRPRNFFFPTLLVLEPILKRRPISKCLSRGGGSPVQSSFAYQIRPQTSEKPGIDPDSNWFDSCIVCSAEQTFLPWDCSWYTQASCRGSFDLQIPDLPAPSMKNQAGFILQ